MDACIENYNLMKGLTQLKLNQGYYSCDFNIAYALYAQRLIDLGYGNVYSI